MEFFELNIFRFIDIILIMNFLINVFFRGFFFNIKILIKYLLRKFFNTKLKRQSSLDLKISRLMQFLGGLSFFFSKHTNKHDDPL